MLGVALGVMALVVVTSVINGFEGELARVITSMNGDVIFYSRGEPIRDASAILSKIQRVVPETRSATASFIMELMASGPHSVAGAVLEGFDPATVSQVTELPKRVIQGQLPAQPAEVALGVAIAERIGARLGDEIRLIIPFGASTSNEADAQDAPKVFKARVSGLVRMGMHEYDSKFIFARLGDLQAFLGLPGRVTSFKLKLAPGASSEAASKRLGEHFGYPFRSKDWAQLNKNLFYAIQLEKAVIAVILAAIVLVASLNVVSTLMLMIHDKTREMTILRVMGLRSRQVYRLFSAIGGWMGIVGTALGIGLGFALAGLIHRTRWIRLPEDIYYIGFLPVVIRWQEIGMIAIFSILIALLASVYPSLHVARKPLLEGLRHE